MSYSQNNEEEVILRLFEKAGINKGRFLDIGAYNGKLFSNTMRLTELGWGGVCVEPSPSVFLQLLELHGDNPGIDLVNAAIGTKAEIVDFYDSGGDAVSTTSVTHKEKWERGRIVKFKRFHIYTISLPDLFNKFGYNFELINIDVENTNWQIFQMIPFSLIETTKIICVEHDSCHEKMTELASAYGFASVHINGENLILSRS